MSDFNENLPLAWHKSQNQYYENLARKILNFERIQKIKLNSVLDICCASSDFLKVFYNEGKRCFGTEVDENFYNYSKNQYPSIPYYKAYSISDIDSFKNFDLITILNRKINDFSSISELSRFFKLVYKHLNNGGIFIFDMYTASKLNNCNESMQTESEDLDFVMTIKTNKDDKYSTISNLFYLKDKINDDGIIEYKKSELNATKYHFSKDEIYNEIKNANFRYFVATNENLSPVANSESLETAYFMAIKRE